jgi:hypothetical protein
MREVKGEAMKRVVYFAAMLVSVFAVTTALAKIAPAGPYVVTGFDGMFYAKAVPAEASGTKGTTKIYRVGAKEDTLLDSYDWYAPNRFDGWIVLGWDSNTGKVSVMRIHQEPEDAADNRVELSFYAGGKRLLTYSTKDLLDMGFKKVARMSTAERRPDRLDIKVIGCKQVASPKEPGNIGYAFILSTSDSQLVHFDISTGERLNVPPTVLE